MSKWGILFIPILLVACSSTGKKASTQKLDKALVKKYTQLIESENVDQVKLDHIYSCPRVFPKHLYKKDWKFLLSVANSCVQRKNWTMTKTIGEQIFQKEPYSPWGPYYLSLESEARGELERSMWFIDLASKKLDQGLFHYQKARLLLKEKKYELAEVEFLQALQMDEKIIGAYKFLGELYLRDLEFKKAIKYFDNIIEKPGYKKISLLGLSISHYELKNYDVALKFLNRYLVMDPYHYSTLMRVAFIYDEVNNEKESALRTYKKIKDFSKNNMLNVDPKFNLDSKIVQLEKQIEKMAPKRQVTSVEKEKEKEVRR